MAQADKLIGKLKITHLVAASVLAASCLAGCGSSSSSSVSVGQKLTMSDGSVYGTVVSSEEAHQFPNGDVEPGVLVDFSPRIPGVSNWLPTRSAATMAQ